MSAGSDPMTAEPAAGGLPPATPRTRPLYWSVRRELWEHRGVYLAPLIVAGVTLFGVMLSSFHLTRSVSAAIADPKKAEHLMNPYSFTAAAVLGTMLIFGFFYSLGALHNERRDRSILFWKSLPVSDLTTVLAKAAIPFVVLPAVVFVVIVVTNIAALLWNTLVVAIGGISPGEMWSRLHLPFMWLVLAYALPCLALWFAPVVAWLMMVSAWAKRMTFLWSVGPWLAVAVVEHLALNSHHFYDALRWRLGGVFRELFTVGGLGKTYIDSPADLDPVRFFSLPALWLGLIVAVVFFAVAVRLRRSRTPI
jgi:ABC-2 type transport system permease protein